MGAGQGQGYGCDSDAGRRARGLAGTAGRQAARRAPSQSAPTPTHLGQACCVDGAEDEWVVVDQVCHHGGRQRKQAAAKLARPLEDDLRVGGVVW